MSLAMAPQSSTPSTASAQLVVIHSQDTYLLNKEGQRWVDQWLDPSMADFGLEIIEGMASRISDGVQIMDRLMEALNTLPVFTPMKVVWLRNTNLFGEDPAATSPAVKSAQENLLALLDSGLGGNFRLLITATNYSRRYKFAKRFPKLSGASFIQLGQGQGSKGISAAELGEHIRRRLQEEGAEITPDALRLLSEWMGPNLAHVENEIQKLICLSIDQPRIDVSHVRRICSPSKDNEAWDLNDALGERNLEKSLEVLDRLLFQGETEVGLLFMMFSKVRSLLILRLMMDRKILRPVRDYRRFQAQFERLKEGEPIPWLTQEKRGNPLLQHPYAVYNSHLQANNYRMQDLTNALDALVQANIELVTTSGAPKIILERALIRAIGGA
jgi:DNA polymerase-3 subunit delta